MRQAWVAAFDDIAQDDVVSRKRFVSANGPVKLFDFLKKTLAWVGSGLVGDGGSLGWVVFV